MGRAKYIYFSDDVVEKLNSVGNMSALINSLLIKYFKENDYLQMSAAELRVEIEKRKLKADFESKLKELDNAGE